MVYLLALLSNTVRCFVCNFLYCFFPKACPKSVGKNANKGENTNSF